MKNKNIDIPKSIWGKEISIEMSKEGKSKRKIKYIKDSLIFASIMGIFDLIAIFVTSSQSVFGFTETYFINLILTVLVTVSILFLISYFFEYIIGEISVKKYNKNKNK